MLMMCPKRLSCEFVWLHLPDVLRVLSVPPFTGEPPSKPGVTPWKIASGGALLIAHNAPEGNGLAIVAADVRSISCTSKSLGRNI